MDTSISTTTIKSPITTSSTISNNLVGQSSPLIRIYRRYYNVFVILIFFIFLLITDSPLLSPSSSTPSSLLLSSSSSSTPSRSKDLYLASSSLSRSSTTTSSSSLRYLSIDCENDQILNETLHRIKLATQLRQRTAIGGVPYSVGDYSYIHPCVKLSNLRSIDWLQVDSGGIGYLVLSANSSIERAMTQLATWGKDINPSIYYRAYGDTNNALINMLTLPDIEGKLDYNQAQHRVLKGLQHALLDPLWANLDFIMILGDDTYVNVPELRVFTSQWNPDVPAMFGWIWHKEAPLNQHQVWAAWPGGGSGMLFTRAAAHQIAQALYTSQCPFEGHDDVTLGYCCWRLGIPQVHSPLFDPLGLVLSYLQLPVAQDDSILSMLTIHRITNEQMYKLDTIFRAVHTSSEISE